MKTRLTLMLWLVLAWPALAQVVNYPGSASSGGGGATNGIQMLNGSGTNTVLHNLNVISAAGAYPGDATGNAATATLATNAISATNAVNTTNVYYGGTVTTTNVVTKIASGERTNANAALAYGGLQLSTTVYGQTASGNYNYRNGVEFWEPGWNGTIREYSDLANHPTAFIHSLTNWGGSTTANGAVLHIASAGNIRIEPNYGEPWWGLNYLTLGNEDGNAPVIINDSAFSITNGANGNGYSLPLNFSAKGVVGGTTYSSRPGIMGWFSGGLSSGASAYDGVYSGILRFYSRTPTADRSYRTFGADDPTNPIEVGQTSTNGWRFYGPVNLQQTARARFSTNIVLDFNTNSAQAIMLASGITNRFSTVNVNAYGGTTNLEPRIFRITAGGLDTPIIWPAWNAGSENGVAPLPAVLPATNVLILRLSGWGDGETNILADWRMAPDTAFAYDSDAAAFFTAASITDFYQKGAVDYLVKALKAANEWTNMVALYPFIGGASNQHALNLKNPATYPITFTGSGVTHNGNGITGNGSSGYGSIPIDWATAIPQSVTNFHLAVYNRTTTPTDGGAFIGGRNGSSVGAGLTRESASVGVRGAMNTLGPNAIVNLSTDLTGPLVLTRANNFNNFDVGTRLGVTSTASDAVTSFSPNPYILGYNYNGSASSFSTANLSFASLGFGFTAAQLTNFMDIIANYTAARSGAALGWAYRYVGTHVGDGSGLTNLPSGGSTTITNTTSAAGVVTGGSGSFGIGTNLTSVAGGTNSFFVAAAAANSWTNRIGDSWLLSGANSVLTVGTNTGNNTVITDGYGSFANGFWVDAGAQEYFVGKVNVGVNRGDFSLNSGTVSNITSTATLTASNVTALGTATANSVVANAILKEPKGTWGGPTNTLAANGGYYEYSSATDCAVTNISDGGGWWGTLAVSNSSAANITLRLTDARIRVTGTASTNALVIPSAKVGFLSGLRLGSTNGMTTVGQ